ncbi:uncharacterized protein [Procambarus clarkii]|uniref:uncharacterized protein isoform X1 n=1 Tax=Procambarus clarkii TaxID=6728 RepID=UPI001E6769EA|nr:uncharacterized protein LOC123763608 isoform X1 [Procambarus clarkii]
MFVRDYAASRSCEVRAIMLLWLIIVAILAQSSSEKSAGVLASPALKTQSLHISRLQRLTSRSLTNTSLTTAVPLLATKAQLINIMNNASSRVIQLSALTSSNGTPMAQDGSSRWDANTTQLNSENKSWKQEIRHQRRKRDKCDSVKVVNSVNWRIIGTFTERTASLYFVLNEQSISVNVTLRLRVLLLSQVNFIFTEKRLCNLSHLHELKVEAFVQHNGRFTRNKWGLKLSVDRCYNKTIITKKWSRINKFKHIEVSAKGSSKWTRKSPECLYPPRTAATQNPTDGDDPEASPSSSSLAGATTTTTTTTHPSTNSSELQPNDTRCSVTWNTTTLPSNCCQPSDAQSTHLKVVVISVTVSLVALISGILIWMRKQICKRGDEPGPPEEPIYEEVDLTEVYKHQGTRKDSENSIYGFVVQRDCV